MFSSPGVCCALPPEISSSPSSLLSLCLFPLRTSIQSFLFSFSQLFLFLFSFFLLSFPSLLPSLSFPLARRSLSFSLSRCLSPSSPSPNRLPFVTVPDPIAISSSCASLFPTGCFFAWNNRKTGFLHPLRPRGRLRQSRRWWTPANFSATI